MPIYESLDSSAVEMEATYHPLSGYGACSCVGRIDQWVSIDDSFVKRWRALIALNGETLSLLAQQRVTRTAAG
jgi:hypothetical protein